MPEPSLGNESARIYGGIIRGGAFYAGHAGTIWEGRLYKIAVCSGVSPESEERPALEAVTEQRD
jgi:hypothetical protein